jgi:acyl transferase domain-containing protein/thioesterase domain-containing protein
VRARPGLDPADVGWSLATTRSAFEHRAVIIGAHRDEMIAGLAGLTTGEHAAGAAPGAAGSAGRIVYVFPGQGSQWTGMGRELAQCCPVFAARLAECGRALAPHVSWDLLDVLNGADGAPGLGAAEVIQPVLWAVMVSLASVWQAAGVVPDAVVGHSQGEIAAATVAGMLSLEDAARVVAVRSRALSGLGADGGMVSVVMRAEDVEELIGRWGDRLAIAAVNGPAATVVSGDPRALAEFQADLAARHVLRWPIPATDFVAHSARVEGLEQTLSHDLAGISPRAGQVRLFSTVRCEWVHGPELDAGYWFANLRQRVRFDQAVRALAEEGYGAFIEVSAHAVLTGAMAETLGEVSRSVPVISGTLDREDAGARRVMSALAGVYARGVDVNWAQVLGGGSPVELPTYAFQRRRYWPAASPQGPVGVPAAGGDGAEAGFWAAVERQDLTGLAGAVGVRGDAPLSAALPVLAAWRRQHRAQAAADRWRYQITWQPVPGAEDAALGGRWLLVVPSGPAVAALARACAEVLAGGGAQVMTVVADPVKLGRDALAGVLRTAAGDGELAGAMSLLALDESGRQAACPAGLAATLLLVQALGDAGIGARLWVLTSGAVAAGQAGPVRSAQTMAWGLGRVAAMEYPARWGGLIDVPATLSARMAGWLRGVLSEQSGEDQVAIREAGVLARRLVRGPAATAVGRWRPSGPVLVTGGTGAAGGQVARWLAGRGAPGLVLVSRRGIGAGDTAGLVARLAGTGTAVTVAACDVADRADLGALWRRQAATGAPVRAVVHAAGVLDDGVIDALTPARLAGVAAVKAAAAIWLDELAGDQVDAFVLFSSMACAIGTAGQGNYAAANAALDAIAEDRRARGLAGTSVAWGVWGGGGLVTGQVAARAARGGVTAMPPRAAAAALGRVLDLSAATEAAAMVADVDWARYAPAITGSRPSPLLSGIPEARQAMEAIAAAAAAVAQSAGTGGQGRLVDRLAGLPAAEQERLVLEAVCGLAALVLGYESAEAMPADAVLQDLGFDSLTAVEFRNRLETISGLVLSTTLVFDFLTPGALAHYVQSELATVAQSEADGDGEREDQVSGTAVARKEPVTGGLCELYYEAFRDGKADDFIKLMKDVAGFRASFDESDVADVVRPTLLARGTMQPSVICFPAFVGRSNVYQYARLAAGFRKIRDVSVLANPGFLEGEPLPASAQAVVRAHASAVEKCAAGAPFALLGHSSGGYIAHAVAAQLETIGITPAAVVLIDTFSPADTQAWLDTKPVMEQTMLDRDDDLRDASQGDSWVTAMARYFDLNWWDLREIAAPTLHVRAADALASASEGDDWNVSWRYARTVTTADVPGNHFSMIKEDASSTAQAINGWLTAMFRSDASGPFS